MSKYQVDINSYGLYTILDGKKLVMNGNIDQDPAGYQQSQIEECFGGDAVAFVLWLQSDVISDYEKSGMTVWEARAHNANRRQANEIYNQ